MGVRVKITPSRISSVAKKKMVDTDDEAFSTLSSINFTSSTKMSKIKKSSINWVRMIRSRDSYWPEVALARTQKVQLFKRARSSYWPEVALAKSGQEAGTGCVHKCQRSKVPEAEVARGQSGHRLKRPEVEVARGRSG